MKPSSKHHILLIITLLLHIYLVGQTTQEVARVSITVSDLEQSVRFYEEVLTFKKVGEYELNNSITQPLFGVNNPATVAILQLGDERIELLQFKNNSDKRLIPSDSKSNDLWFQHIAIVVSSMEKAYERLRQYKVQHVSTAPQTLPAYLPAASGISAFYFRDPDGHNLEIIHFPKGKGNKKWQKPSKQLFLGIDHTAIGIDDTDKSLKFYQDLLGLKVAGNSENYGSEQEHLNQVFGAHLIITGLKAQQGFGVEFLDYLAPPGGRNYPTDSKVTDLWHWHTTIVVNDVNETFIRLKEKGYIIVSQGLADVKHPIFGNTKAFLARDPDGHAILIIVSNNL
ncbi:MAG: VOC family protein [Saprospiraceae bacterium]